MGSRGWNRAESPTFGSIQLPSSNRRLVLPFFWKYLFSHDHFINFLMFVLLNSLHRYRSLWWFACRLEHKQRWIFLFDDRWSRLQDLVRQSTWTATDGQRYFSTHRARSTNAYRTTSNSSRAQYPENSNQWSTVFVSRWESTWILSVRMQHFRKAEFRFFNSSILPDRLINFCFNFRTYSAAVGIEGKRNDNVKIWKLINESFSFRAELRGRVQGAFTQGKMQLFPVFCTEFDEHIDSLWEIALWLYCRAI